MPFLAAAALKTLAKGALTAVIAPFIEDARDTALSTAQNTLRGIIAGGKGINEWAEAIIKGVDKVKDRILSEGSLRYIGGKLKFAMTGNDNENVIVSFELYFLDDEEKWHKAEADSLIPASGFTSEALDEIQSNGEISFEVEE